MASSVACDGLNRRYWIDMMVEVANEDSKSKFVGKGEKLSQLVHVCEPKSNQYRNLVVNTP